MQKGKIPKKRVFDFLAKNSLMSLATVSRNTPWSATVFFAFDEDLNIFFYSNPETLHCRNISRNPRVSLTISHYWGEKGEIEGIQYSGEAVKLSGKSETAAYGFYSKRFRWASKYRGDHMVYKISPGEVWMIDSETTGHVNRVKIFPAA